MNKIVPKLPTISIKSNPLCAQINLTNRCINRCIMCRKYTWPQRDIPSRRLYSIINDFIDMKVETIIFSGGEPLLYEGFLEALEYIKGYSNIKTMMVTTTLSDLRINRAKIAKLLDRIYISFDGLTQKTYSKIRGRGNVTEVKKNILLFRKYNKNTHIWITKQKANEKEIGPICEWLINHDIKYNVFPVHTYNELKVDNITKNLPKYCLYSYCFVMIQPTGEVHTCCKLAADNSSYLVMRDDLSLGNIYSGSINDIWHSKKARDIKKAIHNNRMAECATCDRGLEVNKVYSSYLEHKDDEVFL